MKIIVASKNPIKIEAIKEIIKEYDFLSKAKVHSRKVDSKDLIDQPKSLEQTMMGAINRAVIFSNENYDYGFGIESGLMEVPYTNTGYMDVSACAIMHDSKFYLGLSSAFEYPNLVTDSILKKGINASEAFFKEGLTNKEYIGYGEGIIGVLTKNKITRKEYTKQAIQMALIQLENLELYPR